MKNQIKLKKCPVCEGNEFKLKYSLKDYRITQEPFTLASCQNCNFIVTQDVPPFDRIGKYYESPEYLEHSNKSEGIFDLTYNTLRRTMFAYKYRMIKNLHGEKTILDIGAGSGQFLHYMDQKGYKVSGVELSSKAREYAKNNFGLILKTPEELHSIDNTSKFYTITLWHVIEHLYDVHKTIQKLSTLLERDGYLIIAVPNSDSFDAKYYGKYWAGWDAPRHLWHFTPSTLRSVMKKHGFEAQKIRFLPFDPFFNALLSENYRHGKSIFNIFRALLVGTLSFIRGIIDIERSSSIVYIFSKNK